MPFAPAISLVLTLGAASVPGLEKKPARFAVVVGNNHSDLPRVADLRYADDDAIAFHQLLVEAGVNSVLLVHPDAQTHRLHPEISAAGFPRLDGIRAALARIDAEIREARSRHRKTELFFFFSGHGDVENGEGFVVLEDGHLTRTVLTEEILRASEADLKHVVIDACKSYFLVYEKGPGGDRERFASHFLSPELLRNTGVILSTSSDRDSHEWERFEAGIFSHEVRSGLRGGADTDRNGEISYAELGAFLATANQSIVNARYRPDFVVRPPGGGAGLDVPVLSWRASPAADLSLDASRGHLYLEDAQGDRILDVNAAPGQVLALRVPRQRPLFLRKADESEEAALVAVGPTRLSELRLTPVAIGRKGALHLAFEQLFAAPFDAERVARFASQYGEPDLLRTEAPVGLGRERLKRVLGWAAIGTAAGGLACTGIAWERRTALAGATQAGRASANLTLQGLNIAAASAYAIAGAAASGWLALTLTGHPDWELVPAASPSGVQLSATWSPAW